MNDPIIDIVQRLTRLEVKVDTLLEHQRQWFDVGIRTWVALIGSITAVVLVLIK
jgi:hypothetical protein